MLVFGTRLFGLVHAVPGRFFVATQFLHFFFVPLIPLKSWVVVRETGNGWEGAPTTLSLKSIVFAWCRAALVLSYLYLSVIMALAVFDGPTKVAAKNALTSAVVSLMCLAALRLSYRFSLASDDVARELALKLGYSEEQAQQIVVPAGASVFGRPGWGMLIMLIPLLVWTIGGFVRGRITFADKYTAIFDDFKHGGYRGEDAARKAIFDFSPHDATGIPVFKQFLTDDNPAVRRVATLALAQLGSAARPALPELLARLKDDDEVVRANAASALLHIGEGFEDAVPQLVEMLSQSSGKFVAIKALGALGPKARAALPQLEPLTSDSDEGIRKAATAAIERIGHPDEAESGGQ